LQPSGVKWPAMRISSLMGSVEGLRWKLRGLAAVVEDPAATEHEKANRQAATARLQHRLKEAGSPAGDWTDKVAVGLNANGRCLYNPDKAAMMIKGVRP
jgi:hypothetical protein